jgi:hypothetical protein
MSGMMLKLLLVDFYLLIENRLMTMAGLAAGISLLPTVNMAAYYSAMLTRKMGGIRQIPGTCLTAVLSQTKYSSSRVIAQFRELEAGIDPPPLGDCFEWRAVVRLVQISRLRMHNHNDRIYESGGECVC